MVAIQPLISEFMLAGKLSDSIVDSKGRIKYIYLSTPEAEYAIAVAKQQKITAIHLEPGCTLKVSGMRKNKLHKGEIEYKAYRLELLESAKAIDVVKPSRTKKAQILVCQGKSCCQRGGKTACESLRSELDRSGLADTVEIKTTGCIKQCKQAPNLIMSGRRYSRVMPEQIAGLIEKHF